MDRVYLCMKGFYRFITMLAALLIVEASINGHSEEGIAGSKLSNEEYCSFLQTKINNLRNTSKRDKAYYEKLKALVDQYLAFCGG